MISKRITRRWHPKLRTFIAELSDNGYTLEQGGKHVTVRCPAGRRVGTIASTPSDHRAQLNSISDMRRTIDSCDADVCDPKPACCGSKPKPVEKCIDSCAAGCC